MNQLRSLVATAPDGLLEQLRELTIRQLVNTAAAFRLSGDITVTVAAKIAMREIARRVLHPEEEQRRLDAGLLASSPCARVPLPKLEREEMRFLTPDRVATLAQQMDARYRVAVLLGAYGGLRAGELFGLRRSSVDLLRRRVDVTEIVVEVRGHITFGPPKTRAGRRTVPVPRFVAEALADHSAEQATTPREHVFTAPGGGPVRLGLWRQRHWTPAVRAAGLSPLRIHDLRHTAVALWLAAGANPVEVGRASGPRLGRHRARPVGAPPPRRGGPRHRRPRRARTSRSSARHTARYGPPASGKVRR